MKKVLSPLALDCFSQSILVGAWILASVSLAGCSRHFEDKWSKSRPPVFKTTGTVTWNGAPAAGAVVTLHSESHNLAASGKTDDAGKFTLTTWRYGDGAVSGNHKVTISTWIVTGYDGEGTPIETPVMPAKYENPDTSGLTAEVNDGGANLLSFEVAGSRREVKQSTASVTNK
jgi:hypothetical protein